MKNRTTSRLFSTLGVLTLASGLVLGACDKTEPDTKPPVDTPPPVEPKVEPPKRVYPEPPAPSAQRPVNFPEIQKLELPNKLVVYVVENHEVPIVDVQLVVKAGTIHDELIAGMTAGILSEGTKKRTKAQIDAAIEQVGSSLGVGTDTYDANIGTRVLKPDLALALDLVNDVARNPRLEQAALDKLKASQKVAIAGEKSDGGALAQRLAGQLLYPPGHPYGPKLPTDADVDAITLDAIKAFHDTWYKPNNAYLILSGDVTKDEVRKLVEKTLGTWTPANSFPAHPLEKFAGADYQKAVPTELVVNIVDRNQISSDLILANVNGVARNSPEWNAMAAVVKYFGGGMSSVLFRDIRETQKLTYNINAFQSSQKAVGSFGIATQTKDVDKMLVALFQHIEDLRSKDPDDAYVQAALDNMALSFPLQIETASQIADKVATMLTFNLPDTYYNTYIDDVRKVKVEDIKATAAKHIHPIPVIVIVGKAKKIREQIANVPYLKDAKIVEYDTDLNKK
ncbi:M16 family metallopeptidase [Nannocystaceae bacterium ST9]